MENLGAKIVKLRQARGISQANLANQIDITKAMLSKYENNVNIPKADALGRIAAALGTTSDYLLGLEEPLPKTAPNDGRVRLHSDEYEFLQLYRSLSAENRLRIHERALTLIDCQNKKD